MLEYDEETYDRFSNPFKSSYTEGFMFGRILGRLNALKILEKIYTDDQINGSDSTEEHKESLIKFFKITGELRDFYHKYESLNENQIVKRYIAESECLPWRRL